MKPTYKIINLDDYSYLERVDADGKIWSIPMDEANSDYQAYLESLDPKAPKVVDEAAPE